MEVGFSPAATHAEVLDAYPAAVAAEPIEPDRRQPDTPLAGVQEPAILEWLTAIGETDQAIVAEVLALCRRDDGALAYFVERAAKELPKPDPFPDDRRTCAQCVNLRGLVCGVATPGGVVSANKGYRPQGDTLQRCAGYLPNAADSDPKKKPVTPGGNDAIFGRIWTAIHTRS